MSVTELVTLTDHNPDSPVEVGDDLITPTGRRYRVVEKRGRRLTCVVLGAGEPGKPTPGGSERAEPGDQARTWGSRRVKETPKVERTRLRYAARKHRQATHIWEMTWRRVDGA